MRVQVSNRTLGWTKINRRVRAGRDYSPGRFEIHPKRRHANPREPVQQGENVCEVYHRVPEERRDVRRSNPSVGEHLTETTDG